MSEGEEMINVDETNQFQVQPFIYLEKYDIDVINKVYIDIIGATATKVYFYLNSLRQPSRYGQFAYDTNLSLAQIVDAIKKLEQVELIRSLKRNDRIIHIVQKPNNIVQLLNNPNYIDSLSVENVARNFDISNDNSEITISYFQTQENEIDDFLNNYLLENNVKQKRKIISYVSDLIQLYPTDIFQLKDALENARYFDFIDLERFRTELIANTSLENDINVQFSKINEKIIQETTKSNDLSKELESLLGGEFDSINDFDFATESNTMLANKVDLDLIKHDLLIKEYSSTSVYDFLKIRVGYQPGKSDLTKIEQLAQKYYIPYSAINVLIDYSVFHNIGLNFAYYDAVLKDWYNNSVTSVELAIKYLRSLDVVKSEKAKAKKSNSFNNISNENNDDLADWYDSLEVSTNNMRHEPGQWN
jgi:replication initiation and membrane attachment protein DnaB